ncbi:hypothetical protein D3C73_1358700 [compost metagenome]
MTPTPSSLRASVLVGNSPLSHRSAAALRSSSPCLQPDQYAASTLAKSKPCTKLCISFVTSKIRSSTASCSRGSPGRNPAADICSCCRAAIHFCSMASSAPPSGLVRVDRCIISSRYVASPCPFVPTRRRSGDRSPSATTKSRSIA